MEISCAYQNRQFYLIPAIAFSWEFKTHFTIAFCWIKWIVEIDINI